MRVLVAAGGSGGHVFPALAVLEELWRRGGCSLAWIGNPRGVEGRVAKGRPWLEFLPLRTGGLPRGEPWRWPKAFFRNGTAFLRARALVRSFRPDVVLAMGGYPSVAPVLAAKTLGIPVVLHEQNAQMGLANRFLVRFADLVLLAFPHTEGCLKGIKIMVTGTPVRAGIARVPAKLGEELLVLGGSLGSRKLLEAVLASAPRLAELRDFRVRLVVGQAGDPAALVRRLQEEGISAHAHVFTERVEELLGRARLVLARAGGSTLAELACAGRPAILVPWEAAAGGHQLKNAEHAARAGGFLLLRERDLSPSSLWKLVAALWEDEPELVRLGQAARAQARTDAAQRVVEALLRVGKEHR